MNSNRIKFMYEGRSSLAKRKADLIKKEKSESKYKSPRAKISK